MAGIKAPILDILSKLATINVTDMNGNGSALYTRIWNNHLTKLKDGSGYTFQRPACFVEIINDVQFEIAGVGFRNADLGVRLHLIHDFYNEDGTYEQDLGIFDLRDTIISTLSFYCPTACNNLMCIRESMEYDHDNTYHYILDFECNFMDSKGSPYDPNSGTITESEPDPKLDVFVIPQIPN